MMMTHVDGKVYAGNYAVAKEVATEVSKADGYAESTPESTGPSAPSNCRVPRGGTRTSEQDIPPFICIEDQDGGLGCIERAGESSMNTLWEKNIIGTVCCDSCAVANHLESRDGGGR